MRARHQATILGLAVVLLLAACSPSTPTASKPAAGTAPAPTSAAATTGAPASGAAPTAGAAAGAAPATNEPVRIDMAIISAAGYYIPAYLATDRGFLEQEGIEGEWVVAGTPESVRAVVSGSVPIGVLSSDASIVASTKGAPLRQVAGGLQRPAYDVMSTERIKTVAELRGQEIAVSSVASGTALLARVFIEAKGLRRGEYDLVAAGGNVERISALQSGRVGAAVLADPGNFVVLEQGYTHLGNVMDVIPQYDFSAWWVNTNWLQQGNEDLLVRFLKAQLRARRYLDDTANRESVEAVLQQRLRVSPSIAAKIYEFYTRDAPDAIAKDHQFNERATTKSIEVAGEMGEVPAPLPPASQFYAPQYRERALRELGW